MAQDMSSVRRFAAFMQIIGGIAALLGSWLFLRELGKEAAERKLERRRRAPELRPSVRFLKGRR